VDVLKHDLLNLLTCSGVRTQGLSQVRAATTQAQRRNWTLERTRFGADYSSTIDRRFF
jgi:hypothetical protein